MCYSGLTDEWKKSRIMLEKPNKILLRKRGFSDENESGCIISNRLWIISRSSKRKRKGQCLYRKYGDAGNSKSGSTFSEHQ
jgi:hypothetical protein